LERAWRKLPQHGEICRKRLPAAACKLPSATSKASSAAAKLPQPILSFLSDFEGFINDSGASPTAKEHCFSSSVDCEFVGGASMALFEA